MKRLYYPVVMAAALVAAGSANAQKTPPMGGHGGGFGLLVLDANNDGKLTRAEFDAGQKVRFTAADADRDGFVTPPEMRSAMMKRRMDARFATLDADRNGQISKAEFEAGLTKPDAPGGDLGRSHRFHGPDGRGGPGFTDGRRPDGGPATAAVHDASSARQPRRMGPADANGDGKLDLDEFSSRARTEFDRADTDKNGVVTIAELRALAGVSR